MGRTKLSLRPHRAVRWHGWWTVVLSVCLFIADFSVAAGPKPEPGLRATFRSLRDDKPADTATTPGIALFVESGKPPTPFLPPGKFTATWEGFVNADLRSDFFFQAELNGRLKLEINGAVVLEASATGGASPLSKAIQLKKGANALKATFISPEAGDAFVRVGWTEKGTFTSPIPTSVLSYGSTPELEKATQLRLGRELFLEHRCVKCHDEKLTEGSVPELKIDAPSFEGIGARRNYEWMARWILHPKAIRPSAHMPKILRGSKAKDDAEAMAAYLASLKSDVSLLDAKPAAGDRQSEQNGEQKPLFETLHCAACHNPPDAQELDPKKVALTHVTEKFPPARLAEYLRAPETHYEWTRMPNFKLSAAEAKELAEFLHARADKAKDVTVPTEAAILERGKRLVQTSGCLNCHNLKLENQFSAPALVTLSASKWQQGCLAAEATAESKTPEFGFSSIERAALTAFGSTDRASLSRHVPVEFVERQTRALHCTECHGKAEGFPPLEGLGGKLKPEWTARFISGEISYKPRAEKHPKGEPWLEARMPAFKSRGMLLAYGLAAQHGFPPRTRVEPEVDTSVAELGQRLVGKEGGFSCVSCHGVGAMEALEVFESEGINLAYSAERLLPEYYRRWMRSPLSIDPQTKMPTYFEEDKSSLTEVLDGDAEKQIDAIWHYLRLGSKMPAPPSGPE